MIDVPSAPIELIGDQKRLVQVVTNLLNNIAQYTLDGGRLKLSIATDADRVVINIEDNGIGSALDLLPQVF